MNGVQAADTSYMYQMMLKATQTEGMALVNLMDASRKVEVAHMAPLGNFGGVGDMVDTYA